MQNMIDKYRKHEAYYQTKASQQTTTE